MIDENLIKFEFSTCQMYFTLDTMKYMAFNANHVNGLPTCTGCHFEDTEYCDYASTNSACFHDGRIDGRDIIWLRIQ